MNCCCIYADPFQPVWDWLHANVTPENLLGALAVIAVFGFLWGTGCLGDR